MFFIVQAYTYCTSPHSSDSFKLHLSQLEGGQICHWRMRGDEGLRKLQAEAMKLSLFVCDMHLGRNLWYDSACAIHISSSLLPLDACFFVWNKGEGLLWIVGSCDLRNDALESSCNLLYQVFKEKLYEPPCTLDSTAFFDVSPPRNASFHYLNPV